MRRPETSIPLPPADAPDWPRPRTGWLRLRPQFLLLAGFLLGGGGGIAVKILAPDNTLTPQVLTWFVRPVEQIFLGALFLLIAPLLVSAIVSGASRLRESAGMPDLLATTLAYMLAVSASAALIGLAMANLFRPGDGIPPDVGRQLLSMHVPHIAYNLRSLAPNLRSANGVVFAVIVASFVIAALIPVLRKGKGALFVATCDKVFAIGMKVLSIVTLFAPLAVGCFMFDMMVMFGWHLLLYLSAYILVVLAALALQIVITFFIVVWMRGDLSPTVFLHAVQEAALIAFCTSSSNATLPTALKVAENDLHLPDRIARPILGMGTVANQSGTTIYITVSFLFIGQFFGMDTALDRQAMVFAIATLAGMGTVGVPAGGLPALATVLALTGVPPEGIGLVVGVDRLLDMFRTLVNVVGDLAITVAISREPLARQPLRQ
ncbi:dicarboxylate/amino acid:cation symporter [Novosphingobium sp. 1949]|uniref:Dicarboxylate/amino acid:cation symporter n=1 Tax=Novosphingobium organovorum TaxID=2930092 RepID=A0ABT0BCG8_9SPHN|nr:dicarboxylate/amino acid:cation symporter [Novosphingobium organovorum]MCJ2182757.1 dicarboxylate/amino acid:cation symporter [Novosphingobium organovorum]